MHRIIQLNLKILSPSAPTGSLEVVRYGILELEFCADLGICLLPKLEFCADLGICVLPKLEFCAELGICVLPKLEFCAELGICVLPKLGIYVHYVPN
jgi:hypothetical protein